MGAKDMFHRRFCFSLGVFFFLSNVPIVVPICDCISWPSHIRLQGMQWLFGGVGSSMQGSVQGFGRDSCIWPCLSTWVPEGIHQPETWWTVGIDFVLFIYLQMKTPWLISLFYNTFMYLIVFLTQCSCWGNLWRRTTAKGTSCTCSMMLHARSNATCRLVYRMFCLTVTEIFAPTKRSSGIWTNFFLIFSSCIGCRRRTGKYPQWSYDGRPCISHLRALWSLPGKLELCSFYANCTIKPHAEEHQPAMGNKNISSLRFCWNKNIDFRREKHGNLVVAECEDNSVWRLSLCSFDCEVQAGAVKLVFCGHWMPELVHASSDVREAISLHQPVLYDNCQKKKKEQCSMRT